MQGLYSSARVVAMLTGTLFSFLVATEITAFAQRTPSSVQRRVDQLNRQGEQFERDNLGREVKGNTTARSRSQALIAVKRDLESLQSGYNQIVLAMTATKSVDDARMLHTVEQINECSIRLKHNLALPQPRDDQRKAPATSEKAQQTEPPLMVLRKHIYSFVMSPLFETPSVIDVEHAKNASRDLEIIIEISESISRQHGKKKSSN